jgi:two-component system, OmpR family, alkaline phosphatase synthesis response regulator PhoP
LQQRARNQRRDKLEQMAGQMSQVLQEDDSSPAELNETIDCSDLVLNPATYTATLSTQALELTPTEFRLLLKLARHPGAVVEYIPLVQTACGYICTRQEAQEIIGTHIRNLRQKLGREPGSPLYIEAVRAIDYRLIHQS